MKLVKGEFPCPLPNFCEVIMLWMSIYIFCTTYVIICEPGYQVLQPHVRRVDEGFSEARVLAVVSLLPDKVRVSTGRRAVAMATGVVDRTYKAGQPLKQVLVVVTSGWSVMCFDHNLKKLWEVNLQVCVNVLYQNLCFSLLLMNHHFLNLHG